MIKHVFWIAFYSTVCLAAQTGQLVVTVLDPVGKAVIGAHVAISSRPIFDPSAAPGSKFQPFSSAALTNSTGAASFANVPVGAYAVCAMLPKRQLVDTCTFIERPTAVLVTALKPAVLSINLLEGVKLIIAIQDEQQLLQSAIPNNSGHFRLSISGERSRRRPFILDSSSATSRQYSLLVPANLGLNLHIAGSGFRVADESGKLISKKLGSIPMFLPTGIQTQTVVLGLVKGS